MHDLKKRIRINTLYDSRKILFIGIFVNNKLTKQQKLNIANARSDGIANLLYKIYTQTDDDFLKSKESIKKARNPSLKYKNI